MCMSVCIYVCVYETYKDTEKDKLLCVNIDNLRGSVPVGEGKSFLLWSGTGVSFAFVAVSRYGFCTVSRTNDFYQEKMLT